MSDEKSNKKLVKIIVSKTDEDITKAIEEIDVSKLCCVSKDKEQYLSQLSSFGSADDFSSTLKLIANPLRLKILLILMSKRWACNCEFESAFEEHQTLISHHLRNLREGGLITFQKKGQWNFYRITDEARPFLENLFSLMPQIP